LVRKYLDLGYPEEGVNHAKYLASIEHFDNSIGRIMNKLQETGLDKNTILVFTSDNGGVDTYFDNAPLRYGKGSPYEGGIRVPFIVRWPQKITEGKIINSYFDWSAIQTIKTTSAKEAESGEGGKG